MRFLKPQDLNSGFMVFLLALPLCLAISLASGFPSTAGVLTAGIGALVSSWLGSSRLTIKGPAAGLIAIALASVVELGQGDPVLGYKRTLAVGVGAGFLQMLLAWFRAGILASLMPPSVIHGLLAALGVICIAKQSHVLLGVTPQGHEPLELLLQIPDSVMNMNPEIAFIGILSLILFFVLPKLSWKIFQKIPVPLFVIGLGVLIGYFFDLSHEHTIRFFNHTYQEGPNFLVSLPDSFLSSITFPDFSVFFTLVSFKHMFLFAVIGSIESLLTVSAVDVMDPEKRPSDLNKDLFSVGIGNMIAASLGGLPMISEIVRSKANIDNGAQTSFSNFFHGILLLAAVGFFPQVLHQIPLAVLAAMLIQTGVRLTSPKEFKKAYRIGKDQLIFFGSTFVVTLLSDLLVGVVSGIVIKLLLHYFRGVSIRQLFHMDITTTIEENLPKTLYIEGPCVFANFLPLKKQIEEAKNTNTALQIDLSKSTLIDHTVQEKLHHLSEEFGTEFLIIKGLDSHHSVSTHQHSTRMLKVK